MTPEVPVANVGQLKKEECWILLIKRFEADML